MPYTKEDKEVIASWASFMSGFVEDVYNPIFKPYKISLSDALLIWELNKISNGISVTRSDSDDNEPWKNKED